MIDPPILQEVFENGVNDRQYGWMADTLHS